MAYQIVANREPANSRATLPGSELKQRPSPPVDSIVTDEMLPADGDAILASGGPGAASNPNAASPTRRTGIDGPEAPTQRLGHSSQSHEVGLPQSPGRTLSLSGTLQGGYRTSKGD